MRNAIHYVAVTSKASRAIAIIRATGFHTMGGFAYAKEPYECPHCGVFTYRRKAVRNRFCSWCKRYDTCVLCMTGGEGSNLFAWGADTSRGTEFVIFAT
jgi:hypothetical protein